MRIAIYNKDKTAGKRIFECTKEYMKSNRYSGELTVYNKIDNISTRLKEDLFYYDIYILDAEDEDCISLAQNIRQGNCVSSIVFYNDLEDNINDIIMYRPSYLLKETDFDSQLMCAIKHTYYEQKVYHPYFPIKIKENMLRIYYDDILYFESRQKVCILHTKKQDIEFYAKLSDVEEMLPDKEFNRCHQSYIVNMKNVVSLDKSNRCFNLPLGYSIGISKANYSDAVASYERYIDWL